MKFELGTLRLRELELCRICLNESNGDIHKIKNCEQNLTSLIEQCGGIQLHEDSILPENICQPCLANLQIANAFRQLCQQSNRTIMQSLCATVHGSHLYNSEQLLKPSRETDAMPERVPEAAKPNRSNETYLMYTNIENDEEEYMLRDEIPLTYRQLGGFISSSDDRVVLEYLKNTETDDTDDSQVITLYPLEDSEKDVVEVKATVPKEEEVDGFDDVHKKKFHLPMDSIGCLIEPKRNVICATETSEPADDIASPIPAVEDTTTPIVTSKKRKSKDSYKIYDCLDCSEIFETKSKLTSHMKQHQEKKPHKCQVCLKSFALTTQLARHMNSHTGARPYQCQYCDAKFADPSTKVKHERIHTKERPYSCRFCNKRFSYSNVLKVHVMMHTGEKPYSCDQCGKRFAQHHHKKSHERTHEKRKNE